MLIFYSFFFYKQKTAYEMRISDWSSDVCSSDLDSGNARRIVRVGELLIRIIVETHTADLQRRVAGQFDGDHHLAAAMHFDVAVIVGTAIVEIGRASCRERVCQFV